MEGSVNGLDLVWEAGAGGAAILRIKARGHTAVLPEELEGLPVTALGGRAFAPAAGEEPQRELRELTLPETLEHVGDYAFYGCTGLERVRVWAGTEDWGSGCLMNCRSLKHLEVFGASDGGGALAYFAGELAGELDAAVFADGQLVLRLVFPEYIESYENNDPAHHFDFHLYGPGFPYHSAFRRKRLDLGLYDGAWEETLRREHDPGCILRLAWYRLRYPAGLSPRAQAGYEAYTAPRAGAVLSWLVRERDAGGLSWTLERFRPGQEAVAEAAALARELGATEAMALLLEASGQRRPAGKAKRFDL